MTLNFLGINPVVVVSILPFLASYFRRSESIKIGCAEPKMGLMLVYWNWNIGAQSGVLQWRFEDSQGLSLL